MIHVFGSINIDYACSMERLPGAGETVHADTLLLTPGGKGANQALAAARAGAQVQMHGAVGTDETAAQALALLREARVDLSAVKTAPGPTGCAFISIDAAGENQIVVLAGANASVDETAATAMPLTDRDTLLLQLEVPTDSVLAAARQASNSGSRVVASLAPYYDMPADYFDCVDLLLVNDHEAGLLAQQLEIKSADTDLCHEIGMALQCSVVQTLGAKGLAGWDAVQQQAFNLPGIQVNAVDTVGAGDTFAGYLGAMLDGGQSLQQASAVANRAAATACTQTGAQQAIPCMNEIVA